MQGLVLFKPEPMATRYKESFGRQFAHQTQQHLQKHRALEPT